MYLFVIVVAVVISLPSSKGQCNTQYLTERNGDIVSEGYPNGYPSNLDCKYVISIPDVTNIQISFVDFFIEPYFDKLLIGTGTLIGENQIQDYSGHAPEFAERAPPDKLTIYSSEVWLRFVTSETNLETYRGFDLSYSSEVCSDGFQEGPGERCYFFSTEIDSWNGARRSCQNVTDGDLAIINDVEELMFLVNQTMKMTDTFWWIGLYDVSVEGMWKWVDCSASTAYQKSLWEPGRPLEDTFDCGAMTQNGTLIDYKCDETNLRYVCEIVSKEFTRNNTNVENVNGTVLSPTAVEITWDVSLYACDVIGYRIHYKDGNTDNDDLLTVYGGDVSFTTITQLKPGTLYNFTVAALHIDQELAEVGPIQLQTQPECRPSMLTSDTGNITSPRYPGMYYADADCVWLISVGQERRVVLEFLFADISAGDYIYFGDGLDINEGEFLVLNSTSLELDSGKIRSDFNQMWIRFTSDVIDNGAGFVLNFSTEVDCPQNYTEGPNNTCYFFGTFYGGYVWDYARIACKSVKNGDLVIINDENELAFLLEKTQLRSPNSSWWIGYYDVSVEGMWQWVDCSNSTSFQRDLWAPDEPNNPLDDCGALTFDGAVFDYQCDIRLNFICEVTDREFSQDDINVQNVSVSVVSSSRLEVTWVPSEYNCDVLGYRVYYHQVNNVTDVLSSGFQFVFTLPSTLNNQDSITMYAHNPSNRTGTFNITCPGISYDETVVFEDVNATVSIPQSVLSTGSEFQNGTVVINSDIPIYVHIVIYQATSADAFTVLPTQALGTEYLVASYNPGEWALPDDGVLQSELTVTAMHDNTSVTFELTESVNFQNKSQYGPKKPFEIFLQKWESIQLQSKGDLTASRVVADKPVAVLSGTSCAFVPNATLACDYLVEQMPPSDSLGKTFIVSPFLNRSSSGFVLRIIPDSDDTLVNVSGSVHSISKGKFKEIDITSGEFLYIQSNKPILVAQYMKSYQSDYKGDPSMILVQPIEQYGNFSQITIPTKDGRLTIVSKCSSIKDIFIDDEVIDSKWILTEVSQSDGYCVAMKTFPTGYHIVSSRMEDTVFYVQMYGFNKGVSYAMSAGFTVNQLTCNEDVFLENGCPGLDEEPPEDTHAVNIYGGDATDVILSDLQADTGYVVSVAAMTIQQEMSRVGNILVKTPKAPDCPSWFTIGPNDQCYYFSLNENLWDSSRGTCQSVTDGDYVIINDQDELDYLISEITNLNENFTFWIGLYDVSVEGQWGWIDCSSLDKFQQSLWGPGEPDRAYDCAVLTPDGTFAAQQCDVRTKHGYICEVNPKEYTMEDTNVQSIDAVTLNESSIHVTWQVSNFTCDVLGYRVYFTNIIDNLESEWVLVFPGNASETTLTNLLPFTNYSLTVAALHIDAELSKVGPAFAVTSQGAECNVMHRPPSTTVTSPGYPQPYPEQECSQYISVPGEDGIILTFEDFETNEASSLLIGSGLNVDVSTVIYEFSGSMTSNDTTAPNKTITILEDNLWVFFIGRDNKNNNTGFSLNYAIYYSCPDNYIASPKGHCYMFSSDREWWYSGRVYDCQSTPNGELAIINDVEELQWIVTTAAVSYPGVEFWWIGYYDASVENHWQWVDCTDSTSTQLDFWGDGRPGTYDCGALQTNSSTIVDLQCDTYQHFVCEIVEKDFTRSDTNVKNVSAEVLSSSSIRVLWTRSLYTCDILGYTIHYNHEYQSTTISELKIVNGGDVENATLDSLLDNTMYTISVAAMHVDEELSQVGFVNVTTLPGTTREPTTTPTTLPIETTKHYPIENIENGGVDVKLSVEYSKFDATEQEEFRSSIADNANKYCDEFEVCLGPSKIVSEKNVMMFEVTDGSASTLISFYKTQADSAEQTSVSFYITQADSSELLMLSDDLQGMLSVYGTAIEDDLGYGVEVIIPATTQKQTTKHEQTAIPTDKPGLEPWAITLICFGAVCVMVVVGLFIYVRQKRKSDELNGDLEVELTNSQTTDTAGATNKTYEDN